MLIHLAATAAAAAPGAAVENPYGLRAALEEGGIIAQGTFAILVGMSIFSFYIMFTKLFEQQKIINQGKRVRASFWNNTNLRDGATKLEANSAYRQIVDDGLVAQDQHGKLTDPVDQHDWMHSSFARSQAAVNSKLGGGLAFLATVGATAPFIGLFGTVIGIYRALIRIGVSGQASIDAVAGPVGEALIMTALGLAVAVPAVLAYNWLQRRNKAIAEDLGAFSNDLHGYMMSGGSLKPVVAGRGATTTTTTSKTTPSGTTTTTTTPGTTPAGTRPTVAPGTTGATAPGTGTPPGGVRTGTTTAGQTGGVQTKPNA